MTARPPPDRSKTAARVLTWRPLLAFPDQKALSAFGRVSGPLRSSDAQCFPGKHPGTGDFRDVRGQCGSRVTLVNYDCNGAGVGHHPFVRSVEWERITLTTSAVWFKHQLRHHNLPCLVAQARPVLGLRTFLVPGDDGQNFGVSLGRARQGTGSHGRVGPLPSRRR